MLSWQEHFAIEKEGTGNRRRSLSHRVGKLYVSFRTPENGSMSENGTNPMHRRNFIQAGAVATAAASSLAAGASAAKVAGAQLEPRRKPLICPVLLGNPGVEVTIVNAGTLRARLAHRLLRYPSSAAALLRHGRRLSYRGPVQGLVRRPARGPQAVLPGHQGPCGQPPARWSTR